MSKIGKISKKVTVADILKQKKAEQARIAREKRIAIQEAKEKELAIQKTIGLLNEIATRKARDLQIDTFVKNTAKDMLKSSSKCNLQVFEAKDTYVLPEFYSNNTVWAPWSKMLKK